MSIQSWLRDELQQALDRQGKSGLVVWYDPGRMLGALAERACPPRPPPPFAGSYLALRFALEKNTPDLHGRWGLYVLEPPPPNS